MPSSRKIFKIDGVEELNERLSILSSFMSKKGGRFALRKAANVIRDDAQLRADMLDDLKSPTNISLNIAVRWSSRFFRQTGDLKFRIGILGGARRYIRNAHNVRKRRVGKLYTFAGGIATEGNLPGGDTYYWRFQEFGTKFIQDPNPFMIPAIEMNTAKASEEFVKHYNKSLDRQLKKAGK